MKTDEIGHLKKKAVIKALEKSLGIVTLACSQVDISRSTFYKWYGEDEEFKKQVDDVDNLVLDFSEGQLYQRIKEKNVSANIYHLKTRGRKRGWGERHDIDFNSSEPITINLNLGDNTDPNE